MRCLRKPSRLVVFSYWSFCGKALKRSITRLASGTDGHTIIGCASPSAYITTHASTPYSVESSLAFFIRLFCRFLNIARRIV
ncbi:Os03g0573117 [Oryza sativa Japonica Group]|uniref:Os03g0573117 protein n=1 Tax=Oryza sativa subsp. japonica TaxID=39947 RepID=A0A0P0W050_ORYSJ|nr:hypothetical protein EE612_018550 [Oryza sativa]BAS85004.1 Os03g0573117 [Oryza sativa Japonica Group]